MSFHFGDGEFTAVCVDYQSASDYHIYYPFGPIVATQMNKWQLYSVHVLTQDLLSFTAQLFNLNCHHNKKCATLF